MSPMNSTSEEAWVRVRELSCREPKVVVDRPEPDPATCRDDGRTVGCAGLAEAIGLSTACTQSAAATARLNVKRPIRHPLSFLRDVADRKTLRLIGCNNKKLWPTIWRQGVTGRSSRDWRQSELSSVDLTWQGHRLLCRSDIRERLISHGVARAVGRR